MAKPGQKLNAPPGIDQQVINASRVTVARHEYLNYTLELVISFQKQPLSLTITSSAIHFDAVSKKRY